MKNSLYAIMMLLLVVSATALEVSVSDYDPKPAEAGRAVNVWFKVENPSQDSETNVQIEVVPKDGLSLTTGEESTQYIGILPARGTHIAQFRLLIDDNAFEGSHVIEARVSSDQQSLQTEDLTIIVEDKDFKEINLDVGDVESDPTRIKPDDENVKLDVTLQNIGDGRAQGVKAQLIDLPSGVTLSESYSGTSLLGNVEADSTADATFYIDVDESVPAGLHKATILATYKYKPDPDEDDYLFEEDRIPLDLAIKPVPLYNITRVTLDRPELTAGDDDVRLRITIENIGEEEGESVRIKAYGKTEQPISFDKSNDFVAPVLAPGESGQGTLEFSIDDDAALQKYYLDLEIKNLVNDDVLTYAEKVPIVVSNPKPNNPWPGVIIGLVLIVIAVVVIVARRKKKTGGTKKASGRYGKSIIEK